MTDAAEKQARDIMDNACLPSELATVDHALRTDIAKAIREAVAAAKSEERGRCFRIAADYPGGSSSGSRFVAGGIAAAIRARQTDARQD